MPVESQVVLVEGPWTHRDVTAGGVRFHVAEYGPPDGPLVLLLHGFPEFWWSWRHQLIALGAAGFHVVAPDLRGYGATDKPPRGYDAYTLSSDVAGLVRALGARDAAVVGHDWGGVLAWAVATLHPRVVRQVAVLGMAHPLRLGQALRSDPAQARASAYLAFFQLPRAPEARLRRDDGAFVGELLRRWGGPGFPDAETEARCREALQVPAAAHCALEYYRWAVRSLSRPSGWRYQSLLAAGVSAPVLQLHGVLDTCQLPSTVRGSEAYAHGGYTLRLLDGVGHFPHQEAPATVNAALLDFLDPARPAGVAASPERTVPDGRTRRRPPAARTRDALGRPVPPGSPQAVSGVDEEPLPPPRALALAEELLAAGRAFSAHEVLEASWKAAPEAERTLWQGLAQVCVGLTHLQRGNAVGGERLLRRGAGRLDDQGDAAGPLGVDARGVRAWALHTADAVAAGSAEPPSPPRLRTYGWAGWPVATGRGTPDS